MPDRLPRHLRALWAVCHLWEQAHYQGRSDHFTPPPADPTNPSPTGSPPDPAQAPKSSNHPIL